MLYSLDKINFAPSQLAYTFETKRYMACIRAVRGDVKLHDAVNEKISWQRAAELHTGTAAAAAALAASNTRKSCHAIRAHRCSSRCTEKPYSAQNYANIDYICAEHRTVAQRARERLSLQQLPRQPIRTFLINPRAFLSRCRYTRVSLKNLIRHSCCFVNVLCSKETRLIAVLSFFFVATLLVLRQKKLLLHGPGTYFNCIMFMVASSVVLTVLVLNYHHRKPDNYEMPNWVSLLLHKEYP
ncbi:unnamed protein product [Trichogramma brassicae]|uniref:Neurotransmitter-gated ion-channel transmembrane domain-containing protein n=1 Tax=Trichogramma brassicae TaxID=86971 RepID=A0A6H5IFI3_9HYME|nr:unnamed protein product [Trichogramma brassicae]